jgi:hypothetical protein
MNYFDFSVHIGFLTKKYHARYSIIAKLHSDNCMYCGVAGDFDLHIEHVIPTSQGGSYELDNVVLACPDCNYAKSSLIGEALRNKSTKIYEKQQKAIKKLSGEVPTEVISQFNAVPFRKQDFYHKKREFGEYLENLRNTYGIYKIEFIRDLGLGKQTWTRWVSGKRMINEEYLLKVLDFMGVDEKTLIEAIEKWKKLYYEFEEVGRLTYRDIEGN